jgi:hypothetical protein
MGLPGFTAEEALEQSGETYRGVAQFSGTGPAQFVKPARRYAVYHCHCAPDGCLCHLIGTIELAW